MGDEGAVEMAGDNQYSVKYSIHQAPTMYHTPNVKDCDFSLLWSYDLFGMNSAFQIFIDDPLWVNPQPL